MQHRHHAAIARTNSRLTDNKVYWQGAIFKVGDDVRQVGTHRSYVCLLFWIGSSDCCVAENRSAVNLGRLDLIYFKHKDMKHLSSSGSVFILFIVLKLSTAMCELVHYFRTPTRTPMQHAIPH